MTRLSTLPEREGSLGPVITWDGDSGDFAEAGPDHPVNPGGLVSDAALLGAIAALLFSDSAGEPDPLDPADIDLRGWPGDYFDVAADEAPLGNRTWLLQRRALNAETARLAEIYAEEALQPLIAQGLIGSVTVRATPYPALRRIDRSLDIRRADGTRLYAGPLSGLWQGWPHV